MYLNVISSPGTYSSTEINHDIEVNQPQIEAIQSDDVLLNNILDAYRDRIDGITVLDDGQLKYSDD